ncbi:MAG TPA: hypothetical protein PLX66_01775 [Bacilli bacterium]|nr:hypothetical protein [Bacilli bacterium]
MNDYGEIIKLPYKVGDVIELLRKLTKYDKIKPLTLLEFDEKSNTFHLVGDNLKKLKINIKVEEVENGCTKIEITSKTKGFIFTKDKKVVKRIVNTILTELENYNRIKDNDDFSVEVIKIKNTFKKNMGRFLLFLLLVIILIFITIIMNSIYNYVEYYVSISLADSLSVLFWFLIIIFIVLYPILIKKKGKVSNRKRIAELKSKLCDLIEGAKNKKAIDNSLNQDDSKKSQNNKINSNKVLNYVENLTPDKLKKTMLWFFSICVGVAIIIATTLALSNSSTQIEGTFVQQLDGYTGGCAAIPDEITFKDGLVYGSGAESTSIDGKYEYKIRGNKIYVIINGQEVFSELTIKNKNTLIYGDGVYDEQYYGTTVKVCGVNGDGIYLKQ